MSRNGDASRIAISGTRTHEAVDEGLRRYMLSVYNYMGLGVAFTGAVALLVATNESLLMLVSSLFWLFFIAILGFGFLAHRIITSGSVAVAQAAFWSYATLWGLVLGPLLYSYAQIDPTLVARAFFMAATTFLAMSLYGYVSKRNLSAMGAFCMMAAIGLLVTMLLNAFVFQDGFLAMILSAAVVIVFSLITAFETQAIKNSYSDRDTGEDTQKKAIFGAFALYGNFAVLFVHILNLLGMAQD